MNSHLRIIQVANVRWFNATAWYALSLADALAGAGHRVLTLVLPGTDSEARAADMGLDTLALPLNSANPVLLARTTARLAALTRAFKPHIVNCHRGESVFLWGLLKRSGAGFHLVRTRGDQRPPKGNAANRYLHGRLVDALIATNSRTACQCREIWGLPQAKVHLVPGGVDTRRFFPDSEARRRLRRVLGFHEQDFVLGLLGRFDYVKGQRELMEAIHAALALAERKSPASRLRLMLMGFPTSLPQVTVEAWIRDYGLSDRTVITGKVDDVNGYINVMDAGVIASQGSEAIARAALEIMACGVPLLGTDVGVMPDLLEADALVPAGDKEALAALLFRVADDAAFRSRLLEAQQKRMPALTREAFLEQ
ncbi:glycosyltransferase, partial [Desulfovibrio sp. OttesenSCG-928-M14]|nr:glycosyltransferase [Desulfovibrio sp. OttesenSCG-928-M14]